MFIFAYCQKGSEKALKAEVARDYPDLKLAFSRPGFVTFKFDKPIGFVEEFRSVFARAFGVCLGKTTVEKLYGLALEVSGGEKMRLHVWRRDEDSDGTSALELEKDLSQNPFFLESHVAQPGDLVFDVIEVDPGEVWAGYHRHGEFHSPYPGGKTEIKMDPLAPSRAFLKLEEALAWSQAPLRKDELALEIGCAPGGAAYSLLKRGLKVVGIDPGKMSPIIQERFHENFRYFERPIAEVKNSDLPKNVNWILLDMNVTPSVALKSVERIASLYKSSLRGVLLTLKMNQWKFANDIPKMLIRVRNMGPKMKVVKCAQLSQHRQEILIYGYKDL